MYHSTEHLENQIDRLRAQLAELAARDAIARAERAEAEREALRGVLERLLRLAVRLDYRCSEIGSDVPQEITEARAALNPSPAGPKNKQERET